MKPQRTRALVAAAVTMVAVVVLGLAGCAGGVRKVTETGEITDLLDTYARLTTLSTEEQRREYVAAQSAYERQPGDLTRLRLAMMLALPRAPWRDDSRLLQLIHGMERVPAGQVSPRRELALLIEKIVAERHRMLRDEQKKADEAEHKVNALRAIDRETRHTKPAR